MTTSNDPAPLPPAKPADPAPSPQRPSRAEQLEKKVDALTDELKALREELKREKAAPAQAPEQKNEGAPKRKREWA